MYILCKGAGNIIKKEAAKFNISIPIKPSLNIFQQIKSDKDHFNPIDIAEIYRTECTSKNGDKGYYIGVTK